MGNDHGTEAEALDNGLTLEEIQETRDLFRKTKIVKKTVYYWTMKSGKKIKLTDMDKKHLKNTIRMVERKNDDKFAEDLKALKDELQRRKPNAVRFIQED